MPMQTEIEDQQFYPFLFQQVHLEESCWIENTPYFTRRAIGEWLEYDIRKRDPIGHILRKNPHIDQFIKNTSIERIKDMNDPIFDQLLTLVKDLSKAMKDVKQILDDLNPGKAALAEETETKTP